MKLSFRQVDLKIPTQIDITIYHRIICSGTSEEKGRPSAPPADHFQQRANPAPRSGISPQRVHIQRAPLRAGRGAQAVRDADQDLVPEPARQGQTHRKGPDRPAVPVRGRFEMG